MNRVSQAWLAFVLGWLLAVALGVSAAEERTHAPPRLRVMTFNIHHGEGVDRRIDLTRIVALIRQEQADLVALQEVDKGVLRTQRRDFPAELAQLAGMHCVFSNNFLYQGGEYGNAILSRLPILAWTNTHYRMLRTNEQRGVIQARVQVGTGELLFMATHLDFHKGDEERLLNVGQLKELLARSSACFCVVAGDFNDTPGSRAHRAMSEVFEDAWLVAGQGDGFTITSEKPHKRIDYIWISKDSRWRPVKAWVPRTTASDHLPVVVDFQGP